MGIWKLTLSNKSISSTFAIAIALTVSTPNLGSAQLKVSEYIELAAILNVAENVCNISFGPQVALAAMEAAKEMRISVQAAATLADARHAEILAYLNREGKLDEFCENARAGRIK